jgi:NarL family two-component system response regulator LiaR
MGYLLKDIPAEDLGRAIRTVAAGEFLLYGQVAGKVIRGFRPAKDSGSAGETGPTMGDLTPREVEVLALVARGCTNKEISLELCITVRTVKAHVSSILSKLHAADRMQAALLAIQEGWVPAP